MRKRWLLLLVVAMVAVMAGCGNSQSESQSGDSKKMVLYTSTPSEILNPLVKEFQDRTGITVELVTGGTGELYKRIQAESANPLGDVLWGGIADSLEIFKENFEPYKTTEAEHIPDVYTSPTNHWTAFNVVTEVIMYNKDQVKEDEVPKGWAGLLDAKWKGKIAYADPKKASTSYIQLATLLTAFGKDGAGWEFVEKFAANLDGKLLNGSSAAPKAIADGEFPIGITYEEAAFRHIIGGAPVGIVYPEEGTSLVPDISALIKGAKNSDNGKKFIDFLVSKDVQQMVTTDFKRRAVRDDVSPTEGLIPFADIKLVNYDSNWAGSSQEEILKRFQDIMLGKR